MTFVRKADIEAMFNGNTYTKKVKPERKPITEFYTTAEIKEKFGVTESWIFKVGKEKNIQKVFQDFLPLPRIFLQSQIFPTFAKYLRVWLYVLS